MKDNGNNDNKGQEDSNKNNNDDANETEALMNQLDQLSITENKSFEDLISFQKNSSNILKFGSKELINNFYSNNQKPNQSEKDISNLNSINLNDNNFTQNIELNDKKEILNLKLNNILTTLRLSDIKINIKYYGSLFRFKEYFEDDNLIAHYHSQFNDLFNIIIELLFIIKKEMEKNQMNYNKNNKSGLIMKYQKEINLKNKQIETLLGKLKIEQQKFQKNSKDNIELIVLQKENKELLHQIDVYKNQIKKVDRNNKVLEEKLNNIISEKLHKRSSSVTNNINSISPSTPLSQNIDYITFHESNTNKFSYKNNNNKEYTLTQNIRRLNTNLINIVKDINEKLCTYDSSLSRPNDDDSQINAIKNLHKTNIIADFSKIDELYKNFLTNRDKVLIKIYKLISDNTTINSQTIKKFESPSMKAYSNSDYKGSNEVPKSFINKMDDKTDSKIKVHKKFSSDIKQ